MEMSIGGSRNSGGRVSRSSSTGWSCSIRRAKAAGGGGGRAGSPLRWASRLLHTRVAEDKRPTLERASIRARVVSGLRGRV